MSDWLVLRFPLDEPDDPEVVEVLAEVPVDWAAFLKHKAHQIKKPGRYLAADILYGIDYYYPESSRIVYEKVEKDSQPSD